jgi:Mlc titration factor MtfA (ptsG expression regulator)
MLVGLLKNRRRRTLRKEPVPDEWRCIVETNVKFFSRLSPPDQLELLGHVQVFLAEKRFEGCAGFTITDEVRVTIASQACLLLLHRQTNYFPRLITMLVYPSIYLAHDDRPVSQHIWKEGVTTRAGETGGRLGSMVLAWDAVKAGAADASDGRNVVFHEFAHQLDFEDYVTDGAPAMPTRAQEVSWAAVMRVEFASLRAADETGIPTLLDGYGATNPAEFFAVATEAFFERPKAMRARHPKMYAEMQRFFQQDPTEYSAESEF